MGGERAREREREKAERGDWPVVKVNRPPPPPRPTLPPPAFPAPPDFQYPVAALLARPARAIPVHSQASGRELADSGPPPPPKKKPFSSEPRSTCQAPEPEQALPATRQRHSDPTPAGFLVRRPGSRRAGAPRPCQGRGGTASFSTAASAAPCRPGPTRLAGSAGPARRSRKSLSDLS